MYFLRKKKIGQWKIHFNIFYLASCIILKVTLVQGLEEKIQFYLLKYFDPISRGLLLLL